MRRMISLHNCIIPLAAALLGAGLLLAQQPSAPVPASAGPADPALIEDLIAANRILAQQGVVDGYGHVTVRHNRDRNHFLMARSLAPSLVTANDLIEYDLEGNAANLNGREQYSERFIHAEIYKARPDVNSVVHNHSPSIVPFGVSSVPIRAVYHMAGFVGEGLPIFDIRKGSGITEMLVRTPDRGRALAQVLGNKPAVLMRGHGVAVVGPSLIFAVGRSIYLELNARVQLNAIQLGGSVAYLDPAEAKAVGEAGENRGYTRPWEMWKQQAMGK